MFVHGSSHEQEEAQCFLADSVDKANDWLHLHGFRDFTEVERKNPDDPRISKAEELKWDLLSCTKICPLPESRAERRFLRGSLGKFRMNDWNEVWVQSTKPPKGKKFLTVEVEGGGDPYRSNGYTDSNLAESQSGRQYVVKFRPEKLGKGALISAQF